MLGLGETETELFQALDDLREAQVQVLTLGQYLRPTPDHLPVVEYIRPEVFGLYKRLPNKRVSSTWHPGRWSGVLIMPRITSQREG